MNKGVKPTHLWYKTSQRYFKSIIRDKEHALPRPLDSRDKKGLLQLFGVALSSALVIAYTYGMLSSQKKAYILVRPSKVCDSPSKTKKPCPKPEPCPREYDSPPKPCE